MYLIVNELLYKLEPGITFTTNAHGQKGLLHTGRSVVHGRRYMTANVYLLLYLTECVRELGSLLVCSLKPEWNFDVSGTWYTTCRRADYFFKKNLPAIA